MIRKQVLITGDQNRRLKAAAAAAGIAESELVRAGIELALDQRAAAASDWRARMKTFLDNFEPIEGLAERCAENKKLQSELWRKRIERNRKLFDQKK